MSGADNRMREIMTRATVIPVYTPGSVDEAVQVAKALERGGLSVIEVTLRTSMAMDALKAMIAASPKLLIGAGTVVTTRQMETVASMGAAFAVSPGATPSLISAAQHSNLPYLPGIASASELMQGMESGLDCFKFFPAAQAGGPAMLSALAGPFSDIRFCPTGGITLQTAPDYLALKNVLCVGGSWLTTTERLAKSDWQGIEDAAKDVANLLE
ncbi:MAG: bifunctional 4-hydroxy-2-oxoglutarate aldolase/2-dehydro-3-deoxy-phosphogluconate aldolase [Arenimonas sp.]